MKQMSIFEVTKTINDFTEEEIRKGVQCPCCNRLIKKYRKKLGKSNVATLYGLYLLTKTNKKEFFHVNEIIKESYFTSSGNFTVNRFYGFIEQMESNNKAKKASGYWKITEKGIRFIEGLELVPSHYFMMDGQCLGFDGIPSSFRDCLPKEFDLMELMNG